MGETVSGGGTTASSSSSSSSSSSTGAAATPLFTLVDLAQLEVVAGFSEIDAAKISPGQAATVTVDALPNEKFAAHVLSVDTLSTVTSNVVTYNVTFVLDNPSAKVKPGMSADVDVIIAQADNVLNLTSSAVRTTGGRSTVTVRRNGEDVTVSVVTGLKGDSTTEIVSGLSATDRDRASGDGRNRLDLTNRFPGRRAAWRSPRRRLRRRASADEQIAADHRGCSG